MATGRSRAAIGAESTPWKSIARVARGSFSSPRSGRRHEDARPGFAAQRAITLSSRAAELVRDSRRQHNPWHPVMNTFMIADDTLE
jgi:hypothetical protein